MRLPVTPQISTKDGVSNKNARLTNCLKESKQSGDKAVIRPGLVLDAQASGVGNGLVVFNDELVSVYGTTLGVSVIEGSDGWTLETNVVNSSGGGLICYGNSKFYIVDFGGSAFTTTNLTDVVEKTSPGQLPLPNGNGIAAGAGLVCYIPDNGNVYWSNDDCATWNEEIGVISGLLVGVLLSSEVHFDGTYFIASVVDDEDVAIVIRSTDCVSWTTCGNIISASHFAKSFCTGLGYTYAVTSIGACAYSTNNGLTWTTHPTLTASRDVGNMVLSGSTLVAFGDIGGTPYLYRSTDGTSFTETDFSTIVGGGGSPSILSLVTGELVLTIYSINYYTSTDDGANWISNMDSSGAVWQRSAYGGGVTISLEQATTNASVLGSSIGTIPPLTTIPNGKFDFAQSTT